MADGPVNEAPYRLIEDVEFGENVVVNSFTNLYGCRIGDNTRVGPFVEIQRGAAVGQSCKISSHTFICGGVTLEDEVLIGHGVTFTNDRYPRATTDEGVLQTDADWVVGRTVVSRREAGERGGERGGGSGTHRKPPVRRAPPASVAAPTAGRCRMSRE